jgi:hypothetical protein
MKIQNIITRNYKLIVCLCLSSALISVYAARRVCGTVTIQRKVCLDVLMDCPEPMCVLGSSGCTTLTNTIRITCIKNGWTCITDSTQSCK